MLMFEGGVNSIIKLTPHTISHIPPDIFPRLRRAFGAHWGGGLVIANGDTIHQSFTQPMETDLLVHELVHLHQQKNLGGGLREWWDRYINDPKFRLMQEIEAYRYQYQWCLENSIPKYQKNVLNHCAKELSSKLYGYLVTYDEAVAWITGSYEKHD